MFTILSLISGRRRVGLTAIFLVWGSACSDSGPTATASEGPNVLARLRAVEDEMRADVLDRFFPYVLDRTPLVTADRQVGFIEADRPSRFPQRYDALLSDVVFENHAENRWVMAEAILEKGELVRALLVRMVERIDEELEPSIALP